MKTFLKHFYAFSAIIAGLVITIQAADIDLRGVVIDESGNPVNEAQLSLHKSQLSCLSGSDGKFLINGTTATINPSNRKNNSFFQIRNRTLELGDHHNVAISVFSINGVMLNKVVLEKQNNISLDKLIPYTKSQTVIICINNENGKTNLKAVKCGSQWLWKKQDQKVSGNNLNKIATVNAFDTLNITKQGKKTVSIPITEPIADLSYIILYDNSSNTKTAMIGDIEFSEPSKTFKSSFTLTMSSKIPESEIRYTTDGKIPTTASTLYNGQSIAINKTTQLRAAAFVAGNMSGKSSTAIYIARDFDYTSDIPIIIMDGYGGGKPKDKYNFIDLAFMTFEPVNGVASISNPPTLVTRAGYHLRGQSSMSFMQAPYRIELWDNDNNDVDYPVLGMPSGSDWALISPCTDNSLIRNVLAFDLGKAMGLATVQYRFAEVFINQDNELTDDDYEGIYSLVQPIKNRKNTLNLKQLKPEDNDPAKLSGGYIFKFDQAVRDSGMIKLECTGAKKMTSGGGGMFGGGKIDSTATCYDDLELLDPAEPNEQQIKWITDYIQEFHDALHAEPVGDWKKYVDVNSFVNIHILNELTRDVDAWIRSHFMYKERNKPITAGPVWDYNFALGNMTDMAMGWGGSTKKTGWHVLDNRRGSGDWHTMMWKQPEFQQAVKNRYLELRENLLSDVAFEKLVDDVRKPIMNVAQRNFEAWPMGECYNMGFGSQGTVKDTTWEGQIDSLKIWAKNRLKTLDSLMTTMQ